MPVIKSNYLEIALNFERSVDVTWNRFSSTIWGVLRGFGGSVSIALHKMLSFGKQTKAYSCYLKKKVFWVYFP